LQVLFAAAPTSSYPRSDHSPNHLKVAITEVAELLVDLD
jgi:hypothetical protein